MAALPNLKVIGRHGVGLDIVDLPAATDLGIAVVHAPGSNSNSVAEHAIMLMLACAKQAVVVDQRTRKADWGKGRWETLLRDERQDPRASSGWAISAGGWRGRQGRWA
jgi:lactate dehydrogenase-like 2-hydroxyacid dehydrogenase